MTSGRKRFTEFLKGEPLTRPAFVPLVRGLLSRVEGVPMEKLTSDLTLWANSLMKTTRLFGFDGVVAGLDFTLMPEACGCELVWEEDRPMVMPLRGGLLETPEQSGRMKHALETAARVFETCRSHYACIAAITGPVTLASQLFGPDEGPERAGEVKDLMVRSVDAFCRTRPDVLIFLEDTPLCRSGPSPAHRRIYSTLKNIASHYDVSAGLYVQGYSSRNLEAFPLLDIDIYVLGPPESEPTPPGLCPAGTRRGGTGSGTRPSRG